jgi:hypothetical protein
MSLSGAFQPLRKDLILDSVLTAVHAHQYFAAREAANRLLHYTNAWSGLPQAFAKLTAHRRRKDIRDATGDQSQNRPIERLPMWADRRRSLAPKKTRHPRPGYAAHIGIPMELVPPLRASRVKDSLLL